MLRTKYYSLKSIAWKEQKAHYKDNTRGKSVLNILIEFVPTKYLHCMRRWLYNILATFLWCGSIHWANTVPYSAHSLLYTFNIAFTVPSGWAVRARSAVREVQRSYPPLSQRLGSSSTESHRSYTLLVVANWLECQAFCLHQREIVE